MDDLQLAINASSEVGRLYKDAKAFSTHTPVLALSFLRGLAAAFCNCLDPDLANYSLDDKIKSLDARGLIKPSAKRHLRTLQSSGNKASHPERFDFIELNFANLVVDALIAARGLVEYLYVVRHESVPTYVVTVDESDSLKEMCARAMLDGDVESINQAGVYFKERADQHNIDSAFVRLDGYSHDSRSDIDQAMFWFKQGAAVRHPNCLYQYGLYLATHINVESKQLHDGERFIYDAAQYRHPDALIYVAQRCFEGGGIFNKDVAYSRELFEQAAEQGHPTAFAQLGAIWAKGLGCEIDLAAAASYTLRAAEAGDPQGQFNLFVFYQEGMGLPQDAAEAIRWLNEAAAQDYPQAVYTLAYFIQMEKIPGRALGETLDLFERAMAHEEFRARAALSLAEIIETLDPSHVDLMRAARCLQICYATLDKDGDPNNIRDDCLSACERIVSRLRAHINVYGPDLALHGDDLFTSTLFSKECVPVLDSQARIMEVYEVLRRAGAGAGAKEQSTAYMMREACLTPRLVKTAHHPGTESYSLQAQAVGKQLRNDPCNCGSGRKFKKCHGR
ncbi:SEC-C metal-binding domain-containing protein [Pseudomonas viridiflava]|uniref:SEC-C metal-binding domain-containing protein n=1 Tax=Pseudomonas viridiflava TaxID=33069 RepID=UPI000F071888|nr:SEC-C metal-binding domain-containing protein [Pseudomonas viridiflava]